MSAARPTTVRAVHHFEGNPRGVGLGHAETKRMLEQYRFKRVHTGLEHPRGVAAGSARPLLEDSPLSQTPVTILAGFLGSGKTTLLNRALRDPALARTAVVINEFGEISLDHLLVTASDDNIMVLENGCLCCTVFGDLIGTLNSLYHRREAGDIQSFDRVVIETSGLADPAPVAQAFLSEPTLAGLFRLASVIVTVDAVNGQATLDRHDESLRQVALADHILITKLDLVPDGERSAAEA